jgi:hypothetical protein
MRNFKEVKLSNFSNSYQPTTINCHVTPITRFNRHGQFSIPFADHYLFMLQLIVNAHFSITYSNWSIILGDAS